MENKNSCKENFVMAKTELQDMEAIADFFSNPMIKSGMEMLGEIPGIGSLAKNLLEQEVASSMRNGTSATSLFTISSPDSVI